METKIKKSTVDFQGGLKNNLKAAGTIEFSDAEVTESSRRKPFVLIPNGDLEVWAALPKSFTKGDSLKGEKFFVFHFELTENENGEAYDEPLHIYKLGSEETYNKRDY